MGLLDRIFGNANVTAPTNNGGRDAEAAAGSASTQFRESEPDPDDSRHTRNAPRRELVQVVLRDTMRKHGIPSDWVECRILSTVSRSGRTGLHVNFVVRKAHDRLLAYVFAFQDSFERELARFEPRARDWLVSLGWEFQGFNPHEMPDPGTWVQSGPAPLVQADWTGPQSGFGPSVQDEDEPSKPDEDVQHDLRALFAIRDAAMADTARPPASHDHPDFEPTQSFEDSGNQKP